MTIQMKAILKSSTFMGTVIYACPIQIKATEYFSEEKLSVFANFQN